MENELAVHQKRVTKQPLRTKKKALKVVYISSPMKVKTSASEFRALVQRLTGRDADTYMDPRQFWAGGDGLDHQEFILPHATEVKEEEQAPDQDEEVPTVAVQSSSELTNGLDLSFDDAFVTQTLENFPGFLPSNSWYESAHFDVLKMID